MLILHPKSTCDVCFDSYVSSERVPYVIKCGHILCEEYVVHLFYRAYHDQDPDVCFDVSLLSMMQVHRQTTFPDSLSVLSNAFRQR